MHRLAVKLDVFSSTPLYQQLASEIHRLIDEGLLTAGTRLPSLRDLSKQLQISVITVRQAMDILLAEDYVVSRPGSGNFVSASRSAKTAAADAVPPAGLRFVVGSFRGVSYDLSHQYNWGDESIALNEAFNAFPFHPWWDVQLNYDFRAYQPSAEFLRGPRWEKAFDAASKALMDQQSDPVTAEKKLREHIATWLRRSRGLDCDGTMIVITSGAQQARELVARSFVRPERPVVVEEPGSITDLLAYATKGGALVHANLEDDGIDLDALNEVTTASIAHLITSANFPTGITMSEHKRNAVVQWAKATGSLVVEDGYGAGFNYEADETAAPRNLFSLCTEEGVPSVYIGSLSQFTTPALRIGFIVAPEPLRTILSNAKHLLDGGTSLISAQLAWTLFEQGFFDEHYLRLMKASRIRRQVLLQELQKWPADLISFAPVSCGFQQAVWFKRDIDDLFVFEQAMKQQVGVIPLSPYFHKSKARSGLSLNFARNEEEPLRTGLRKLLDVVFSAESVASTAAFS